MDEWRTLLLQGKGAEFRPGSMGLKLTASFEPGMMATFCERSGQAVDYGGALYRVPDDLPRESRTSQYEAAFTHLLHVLPAFRAAGATDFILHLRRTCRSVCNEEFTRAELQLLASLDCHFFYAAHEEWASEA